jgi:hypothetical protein
VQKGSCPRLLSKHMVGNVGKMDRVISMIVIVISEESSLISRIARLRE